MNGIKVVIGKELARVFGDKKLVFSLFIMPALLMLVLYSLMGNMMNGMMDDIVEHTPIVTIQNAPQDFKDYIENAKVASEIYYIGQNDSIETAKEQIKTGEMDLILLFPENFTQTVENYTAGSEIPEVKTYYNPSEDYSSEARSRYLNEVFAGYKQEIIAQRIGDLETLTVFHVDLDENNAIIMDEKKAGGKMLAMMLPYLIVMLLFTGPMSLGIDAITGEKERGTMATMLVSPVKRSQIVIGKITALSILSMLSAIVYAVSIIISVPKMFSGMEEGMGAGASFSILQILQLLLIMVSLVYFYVAIVTLISIMAKTAKEAGTYVSPVYIVVIVAGVLTMFGGNNEIPLPLFGIPVYGSAAAIQKVMTGELTGGQFGISILGTVVLSVLITVVITKAFNSEKVMFNA